MVGWRNQIMTTPEQDLQALQQRILHRFNAEDRSYLTSLLTNILLFIRRRRGEKLTSEEQLYPPHSLFAHHAHPGGLEVAETLAFRLRLIDQYQPSNIQYITDILTLEYPASPKKFSNRKALIIKEVNDNPRIPKSKLAEKVGISSRVLSQELKELRQEFAFQVITTLDIGKFRLLNKIATFRLKSTKHAERLEEFFRQPPGFFRIFQLDRAMLQGGFVFRIPDQREAHKLYEQRIRWLQDEFFTECHLSEVQGTYYFLSLTNYDPDNNVFTFDPEIVSEAPFSFAKHHQSAFPQLKGFKYSKPIWFDHADFLLAHTLFARGEMGRPHFKQRLLEQYGIKMSLKTMWKRLQRLRAAEVAFPIVDLKIPGFDEYLTYDVLCSPTTLRTLQNIATFLPYVQFFTTDSGCILNVQRPIHASSLTGQLLRTIHREPGVSDVNLLRYQWRLLSHPPTADIRMWDVENQRWRIQEGDL
jgi:hypothetical protein